MTYIIDEKDNNKVWESGYAIYCQCGVYPSFDALEYDKISIEKNLFHTQELAIECLNSLNGLDERFTFFVLPVRKFCKQ